jgi:hypothetical protein
MNAGLYQSKVRRWLLTLVVAALLAVSASYAPVLLDELAAMALTPQAFACQPGGSGCG